jgi:hypothetical protein
MERGYISFIAGFFYEHKKEFNNQQRRGKMNQKLTILVVYFLIRWTYKLTATEMPLVGGGWGHLTRTCPRPGSLA